MSKQKKSDSETEATTENLVEQRELDGITSIVGNEAESSKINIESAIEGAMVAEKEKSVSSRINKVPTAAVSSTKKMGVYKFLSLYPQDIYISTLLKHYYPKSFFTKDEWFQCIEDILHTPIYC